MGWMGVKSRFSNSFLGESASFILLKMTEIGSPNIHQELFNRPARDPGRKYFPEPEIYTNLAFIIVLGTVLYGAIFGPYVVKRRVKG